MGIDSSPATQDSQKQRKRYTLTKTREKWSDEEHARFLEAVRLYDRNWRRVSEHVGTKKPIQVRSHAQKVFMKMRQEGQAHLIPPPKIQVQRPTFVPAATLQQQQQQQQQQPISAPSSPVNDTNADNQSTSSHSVLSSSPSPYFSPIPAAGAADNDSKMDEMELDNNWQSWSAADDTPLDAPQPAMYPTSPHSLWPVDDLSIIPPQQLLKDQQGLSLPPHMSEDIDSKIWLDFLKDPLPAPEPSQLQRERSFSPLPFVASPLRSPRRTLSGCGDAYSSTATQEQQQQQEDSNLPLFSPLAFGRRTFSDYFFPAHTSDSA